MNAKTLTLLIAVFCGLFVALNAAHAQGTAFTYQGQLQNNAALANGTFNLTFTLYTVSSGGIAIAGPVTNNGVIVANGLFLVKIDFGSGVWCGETNWLQIGVATNGTSSFTALNVRQQVTPAPLAITAENLCGTVASANIAGTYGNQITLNNAGNQFSGTFNGSYAGNGSGLTNVNVTSLGGLNAGNFWQLLGNTVTNGQFLGSLNNSPVEIHVNGQRALLLQPNTGGAPNVIGGSLLNSAGIGVGGATIGGGGGPLASGNSVNANLGTVGGGIGNTIGGAGSFIGGGGYDGNIISGNQALANAAVIGGGIGNQIPNGGFYAVIGGGKTNNNAGNGAVIGGGLNNGIQATANDSVIGGGQNNLIDANSTSAIFYNGGGPLQGAWATVSGGWSNTIQSAGSSIGGGFYNVIDLNSKSFVIFPSGQNNFGGWAVIAGGAQNTNDSTASFIGGGGFNDIQSPAYWSVICGGENNIIDTNSYVSSLGNYNINNLNNLSGGFSAIVGGADNKIRADTSFIGGGARNLIDLGQIGFLGPEGASFIGGGIANSISNSSSSVIGGGVGNHILLDSDGSLAGGDSTIGGGSGNQIFAFSGGGFIGGGSGNTVDTNGAGAVIAGGSNNRANGMNATVPGGIQNVASGQDSFAAGDTAMATNDYSFVWSDNTSPQQAVNTGPNQFIIGATGGVAINRSPTTNNDTGEISALSVNGGIFADYIDLEGIDGSGYLFCGGSIQCDGQVNSSTGISSFNSLMVASNTLQVFNGSVTVNGTFNDFSDRNAKQNFAPVSPSEILDKVAHLPVSEWSYKVDATTRHLGPMAQDFHAAFNVGTDERHIAPIDEGGVALAAIQGLNQKLNEKDAEIQDLKKQNDSLAQQLNDLAAAVKALQEKKETEKAKDSDGI
jgi:hypothetical protein